MQGNDGVLAAARDWRGMPMALATVTATWGSAPRPVGSHMLIRGDGRFEGSVSGGCVEADVLEAAAAVLAGEPFQRRRYGVDDAAAWEVGLPCGGAIEVMVQVVGPDGFDPTLFERIAAAHGLGRALAVHTDLDSGRAGLTPAPAGGRTFVNRYEPPWRLLVVGAVQIAQALCGLAAVLGLAVVVIDPRERFLTPERFPAVSRDGRWPDEAVRALRPDGATAVVVLSHDSKLDDAALVAALEGDAAGAGPGYVGALGSRRNHAVRRERLLAAGLSAAAVARIDAPVGLDIGAVGPGEIALSIMGAVVSAFRRGGGDAAG
ncbi:MAG: XdhC family protein [Gluconacetobacter diazotrophicus]|nr:XdhC family protein [Gluconacetobacter diazotrophicus]